MSLFAQQYSMTNFTNMSMKKYLLLAIIILIFLVGLALLFTLGRDRTTDTGDEAVPIELINEEGKGLREIENYEEELIRKNPLIGELPHTSEEFEIYYGVHDEELYQAFYLIVLQPKSNPENAEMYSAEIIKLRNSALAWIENEGFNPDNLNIKWTTK